MLNKKNKDLSLMQNVPRNPMAPFVFLYVVYVGPPKNHVWLYDVTIRSHVVEINLAFGGQKSMYQFEIVLYGWRRLVV